MNHEETRRRGEQLIGEMMGEELAERMRAGWRDISPDFEDYVARFVAGEIWSRPGLDRRTRSLVTLSALVALGRPMALELNLRMARRNGVTREEVTEAMLHLAPYAGFPACWEGLAVARKVFREEDETGAGERGA